MRMTLQGQAKVRRVGNGLCVPLPKRALDNEGIKEGDEVVFFVYKPRPPGKSLFGAARELLAGVDLQALADEDRDEDEAADARLP